LISTVERWIVNLYTEWDRSYGSNRQAGIR